MSLFQDFLDIFVDSKPKNNIQVLVKSTFGKYKEELPEVFFDEIFVWVWYEEILPFLELYKFHSDRSQAEFLSDIFIKIFQKIPHLEKYDTIIPMSMHWSRYWIRGFDSIGLIAEKICQKSWKKCEKILKTSFTKRQVGLSRLNRLKNRKNIFSVRKNINIPEKVILLDDIVTTGATVNEAAKILKQKWIKEIIVVALSLNSK